jgi:uncharacterized repeat protein (TIGR03803 family)
MKISRSEPNFSRCKQIVLPALFLVALHATAANEVFQSVRSFGQIGPGSPLLQGLDGYLYGTSASDGPNGAGTVFRLATNGTLSLLYAFTGGEDGGNPFLSGLVQSADGNFYGIAGGELGSGAGTVFRLTTNGTLTTLHSFSGLDDGSDPVGLLQARDGNLYGETRADGIHRCGTIFRITTNGILTTLYSFAGQPNAGFPHGGLLEAGDGNLYGTTTYGGAADFGAIFRISAGGRFTPIYSFNGLNDGRNPWAALIQASDGNLYGTTVHGGTGTNDFGTLYRITPDGTFSRLHVFTGGNGGANPYGRLVQAGNGNFYGTTFNGGPRNYGTVFRLATNGSFVVLHYFTYADGAGPLVGLVLAADGNLYGTTAFGGSAGNGTAYRITPNGAFSLLRSFPAGYTGVKPLVELATANDGSLYGVTSQGGSSNLGTIFGIGTDGAFTSLHSFSAGTDDGQTPSSLVAASDGNLYGTTESGGTYDAGTVFRITPDGVFTLLHSFTAGNDGAHPWSGLVQARDGRLYGTTGDAGANGSGTAFRITLNGDLTAFSSFAANIGGGPRARLIQASDGAFYGTSTSGGTSGGGTVYRLTTNGVLTILRSFAQGPNGYYLTAPVLQASDGHLYGMTDFGGTAGLGTLFRLTRNGAFTLLHTFNGADGDRPSGGLVQANDGYLYGTTSGNPFMGRYGSVFRIATNGQFTVLSSFTGGSDGGQPSGLVQAGDGNLYGTTYLGGVRLYGTVFRILIAPATFRPPLFSEGNCLFGFQTVIRRRYTVEQRPDLSSANWSIYTTVNGNGSLFQFVIPTDYYPEQYFRVMVR